jgi:hypothetical protein
MRTINGRNYKYIIVAYRNRSPPISEITTSSYLEEKIKKVHMNILVKPMFSKKLKPKWHLKTNPLPFYQKKYQINPNKINKNSINAFSH